MQIPFENITYLKNNFTTEVSFISSAYNFALYPHVDSKNAILHLWTTNKQVALGHRDNQLPYLTQALDYLKKNNFNVYNRSAGGLAVISDFDILNGSLIFQQPQKPLTIDEAYDLLATLLKKALPNLNLTIGEIKDSYCPGAYDISVNGKKIAGLAQHRYQGKIAVSFYLSVGGNQDYRCKIIKNMYLIGLNNNKIISPYPSVNKNVMTSLNDISHYKMTQIIHNLTHNWFNMEHFDYQQIDNDLLNKQIIRLKNRQQKEVLNLTSQL